MDMAERNGADLRRWLRSADRFKDAAMRLGSRDANTPLSRVSASLCSVTSRDQRRPVREGAADPPDRCLRRWLAALRPRWLRLLDAVAFRAMTSPELLASCDNMRAQRAFRPALALGARGLSRP